MPETEPYILFVKALNGLGVPYMITGSVAATMYGEPRNTNDVDIVVELADADLGRLAAAFPLREYYCPPDEVLRVEIRRSVRGHFNLIHHESGFKADMYPIGEDALHRWAMLHRHWIELEGENIPFAPPEYVIVRKLEFYREGGSDKHLRDIRSMLRTDLPLDTEVLEKEIAVRKLDDEWARVR